MAHPTRRRPRHPVAIAALAVVAGLASCGNDDDAPATGATTVAPSTSTSAPGPTCEPATHAGRSVVLCTAGDAADQGLVVALHGRGSSAEEMQAVTELDRHAAAEGLAVA